MKFLNVAGIVCLLFITWVLWNKPSDISEEVHVGIQTDLKRVIKEKIAEQNGITSEVDFKSMWTEVKSDRLVKAHFVYEFSREDSTGEITQEEVTGHAFLKRGKSKDKSVDLWNLTSVHLPQVSYEFKNAIEIKATDDGE